MISLPSVSTPSIFISDPVLSTTPNVAESRSCGLPMSIHKPDMGAPNMGLSFSNRRGNTFFEKSNIWFDGIKSRTSGSRIYIPAFMRLENTSSSFGFSLNLMILLFSSNPTIPNSVGFSTSVKAIVATAFFF